MLSWLRRHRSLAEDNALGPVSITTLAKKSFEGMSDGCKISERIPWDNSAIVLFDNGIKGAYTTLYLRRKILEGQDQLR